MSSLTSAWTIARFALAVSLPAPLEALDAIHSGVDCRYDDEGAFTTLRLNGETLHDTRRDRTGRVVTQTQGALETVYEYDPAGRLSCQTSQPGGAGGTGPRERVVLQRDYGYDAAGNLARIEGLKGTTVFRYDPLDRITAVNG